MGAGKHPVRTQSLALPFVALISVATDEDRDGAAPGTVRVGRFAADGLRGPCPCDGAWSAGESGVRRALYSCASISLVTVFFFGYLARDLFEPLGKLDRAVLYQE